MLEHGLAHFACRRCGEWLVVAYSCKTRGNRTVVSTIAIVLVGEAALIVAGRVMDLRALWLALGYAVAFVVSVLQPDHYTFALAGRTCCS
jgi:hypothetical protein